MSENNYEGKILEAIQLVVDNAVSTADFDKTIQCIITRAVDTTLGKYTVSYQNSTFYAYTTNTETTYNIGTSVYVLVPGNDMSNEKTIIGSVDKLGTDYIDIVENEKYYEMVGSNVVGEHEEFGLCSYNADVDSDGADIAYVIYDKDKGINEINLDEYAATFYIQKSEAIQLGATFRTALSSEQKFKGDYGIIYELDFHSNVDGSVITRNYLFNVDMMSGNPYTFTVNSRQYGIYDVDSINFIEIKSVSIYQKDFPVTKAGMPNDIFISNLEIGGLVALDATDATTCALTFITKRGIYFDETDLPTDYRTIEAEVRVKGVAIDTDSQRLDYYWFIENGQINTSSLLYNKLGGAGWACLNDSTTIVIDDVTGEVGTNWIPEDHNFITTKAENLGAETRYKCVVIYSDELVLSKEITIYNLDSDYNVTIESDSGTDFYFDVGRPTLECKIQDKSGEYYTVTDFDYVWHSIDNNNSFSSIGETTATNTTYTNLLVAYAELLLAIENETIFAENAAAQKLAYEEELKTYENITRVQRNFIHKLNVAEITGYTKYKCSIYSKNDSLGRPLLGTASIVITNVLSADGLTYRLVINNADVIFKYNVSGISPTNASMEVPQLIQPLTFTLFDDKGYEVDAAKIDLKQARWVVPTENTMLKIGSENGNPSEEDDINGTATYVSYSTLYYEIANTYNAANANNTIYLYLTYLDKVIAAKTDLVFLKEGSTGTNGTDLVARIIPAANSTQADAELPAYPQATIYATQLTGSSDYHYSDPVLNYNSESSKKWFKVELWEDGEQVFSGNTSNDNLQVTLTWSILKNIYASDEGKVTAEDLSYFTIDSSTGEITFNYDPDIEHPNCVVRCCVNYKGKDLYVTIPVTVVVVFCSQSASGDSLYDLQLVEGTGFRDVVYTTSGELPAYDTNYPFQLKASQNINGTITDISLSTTDDYALYYDWHILGQVYMDDWVTQENIEPKTSFSSTVNLLRNEYTCKPVDVINGYCVNNGLKCILLQKKNNVFTEFGIIYIPIQMYLNRYGQNALNGWDGNSISISEEEGFILAPQVGAGYKEEDNSYTGVLMGSIKESGAPDIETGLFGYYAGTRTIKLDAETGSAAFGKAGAGQVIIDPSSGQAIITSGNFVESDGKDIEGTGMEINLSEPSIKFGSGNFSVDKDGSVVATEYTTSSDFNEFLSTTVVQTIVLYGISTDPYSIPHDANWYVDGTGIELNEGEYLWQKTREIYGDGHSIETDPIRVTGVADTITSVDTQYLLNPTITEKFDTLDDTPGASFDNTASGNITLTEEIQTGVDSDGNPVITMKDHPYTFTVNSTYTFADNELNAAKEAEIVSSIKVTGSDYFLEETPITLQIGDKVIFRYPTYVYAFNDEGVNERSVENPFVFDVAQEAETTVNYKYDGTFNTEVALFVNGAKIASSDWTFFNIVGSDLDPESLNGLEGWRDSKPAWKENYDLWIRMKTIWASEPDKPVYSIPYKDLEVESLQEQITDATNDILASIGEKGCVRIVEDKIFIMDNPELEESKNVYVMSDEGMLLTKDGIKWDSDLQQYVLNGDASVVVHIDEGVLSEKATIGEIQSDICDAGELKLRPINLTDADDDVTSGRLRVFDKNNNEIGSFDSSAFNYYQENGGSVSIGHSDGLQVTGGRRTDPLWQYYKWARRRVTGSHYVGR